MPWYGIDFYFFLEFLNFAKLAIINANILPWLHKRFHFEFLQKSFINVTTSVIAYGRNLAIFIQKICLKFCGF